ncbi:MAG: hypothetical protein IPN38_06915 [Flavobacteriales bacterium]|nr:hypothetical protein [Flavobacteriales bacterium]
MDTAPQVTAPRAALTRRDPVVWIGLALFAFQAFLALRFYLERTGTADSSFFSFLLVDSGLPVEALGRYGSWLAQLIPLAFIHGHAPLSLVLKSYSLSFVLIDVVVFLFIALRLKDKEAAIALPLAKTVAFHYTFYYGISELNQGLTLMVLLWALLKRFFEPEGHTGRAALVIVTLTVWSSFYHQLLVFPLALVLAVEMHRKKLFRAKWFWGTSMLLLGWFAVRILFFTRSSYEAQRMPSLEELITYGSALGDLGSTQHLLRVFPKFKAFLLLVLITLGLAIWKRAFLLLTGTVLLSAGVLLLVLITDRDGASPNIYENYYTLQGFFWAVLFARLSTELERPSPLVPIGLTLCLLLGGLQIWRAHAVLSAHVRYAQRITDTLRERGTNKAVGSTLNFPWAYAWGQWPLAMETVLVSAQGSPGEAASVFMVDDASPFDSAMVQPYTFLGPNWNPMWFTTDHFPRKLLHLPRHPYVRMNTLMPDSVEQRIQAKDILIEPLAAEIEMDHDRYTVAEVRITNRSSHTLGSFLANGSPMRLAYHLLAEDGTILLAEGSRTELEIDLPPGGSHVQGVVIERPVKRGTYHLQIDLLTEGRRWWGLNVPMTVHAGW